MGPIDFDLDLARDALAAFHLPPPRPRSHSPTPNTEDRHDPGDENYSRSNHAFPGSLDAFLELRLVE